MTHQGYICIGSEAVSFGGLERKLRKSLLIKFIQRRIVSPIKQ